jgi:hypothetical protein
MSTCITFHMSFIDFLPPHKLAHMHTQWRHASERGLRDDIRRETRKRRSLNLLQRKREGEQARQQSAEARGRKKNFFMIQRKLLSLKFICIERQKEWAMGLCWRGMVLVVWILIGDAHICTHCEVLFSLQLYRFFHPSSALFVLLLMLKCEEEQFVSFFLLLNF